MNRLHRSHGSTSRNTGLRITVGLDQPNERHARTAVVGDRLRLRDALCGRARSRRRTRNATAAAAPPSHDQPDVTLMNCAPMTASWTFSRGTRRRRHRRQWCSINNSSSRCTHTFASSARVVVVAEYVQHAVHARAAPFRRRPFRRDPAPARAATAGHTTTSPSSTGDRRSSVGASGPGVRWPGRCRVRASIGNDNTSVGRGLPRYDSLSSAMSASSTNSMFSSACRDAFGDEHASASCTQRSCRPRRLARRPRRPRFAFAADTCGAGESVGRERPSSHSCPAAIGSYAATMSATMRWRTTSAPVRWTNSSPSMPPRMRSSPSEAAAAPGDVDLRHVARDHAPWTRTRCG